MKRKRAVDFAANSIEATKVKRQRSQTRSGEEGCSHVLNNPNGKSPGTSLQCVLKNRKKQLCKRLDADTKFVESVSLGLSSGRKKRKFKDINQNGDVIQNTNSTAPSTSKNILNNGLHTISVDGSDLVSKKQNINFKGHILGNADESSNLTPVKKKPGRKRKVIGEMDLTKISQNDNANKASLTTRHSVLKKSIRNKQIPASDHSVEIAVSEATQKKTKKKVRIDETESLKIKQEIAESELHFSVKELPAKIIKSKSNKNLTEEVKVSPLTVQDVKKEILSFDEIKVETEIKVEKEEEEIKVKKEEGEEELGQIHHIQQKISIKDEVDRENLQDKIKYEDILEEDHIENSVDHEYDTTSEESDLEVYYINKNAEKEARKRSPKRYSMLMPKEDQLILVQRMQEVIPEGDTKSYKYRLQHLEWQKVAFKNYSLEECQKVWVQLLKKVRHYRLLVEITHDVKKVIELSDLQVPKPRKTKVSTKKHPDMPKRPLTSYFLYYIRKRNKICKERPDLDTVELNKYISEMYQNLPLEKKHKYEVLAVKNREQYKKQLEEFYAKHPEMRKVVMKRERQKKEKPPKRPENPYKLFVHSELSREEIAEEDKSEFNEVCKEKWRQMSDSKKLEWINLAEEHHKKYEKELHEYMAKHPEYTPKRHPHKPILSRQELNLKDKLAGKPKKPPGTAYGLFLSMTMQSNETADIPPRERWNYASIKWKAMSEEERDQQKQLLLKAHEQYEKDFKVYLDSLPEDKRQAEILKNLPKKRKNAAANKSHKIIAKTKRSTAKAQSSKRTKTKVKLENPVPPPRSTYKYFAEKFEGENPKEAWRNLSRSEKGAIDEELNAVKEQYIRDYEAYLKSLTKEELAIYCAKKIAEYTISSEDDDSDSERDEDSSDETYDSCDSENEYDEN